MDHFDQSVVAEWQHSNSQPQSHQEPQNGAHNSPAANDEAPDPSEPIFNLPPPPESTYPCEALLEKAMHAWSLEHGYELVRRASKKNSAGKWYKRYYHCSKHGLGKPSKIPAAEKKRQKRTSNRIGCQMSLAAVAVDPTDPDGEWQIRHRKTWHNHPATEGVELSGHRRRAREGDVQKAVDSLFELGTSNGQVLQFLKKTQPGGLFTKTDVANMKGKWRRFGSSAYNKEGGVEVQERSGRQGTGVATACAGCRRRKVACGSQRPSCRQCQRSSMECEYDHELDMPPEGGDEEGEVEASQPDLTTPIHRETSSTAANNHTSTRSQAAATREMLESLLPFQAEAITRERLHLQSSSVEVLAQSSCGNGESFKAVPTLSHKGEWEHWKEAVFEAARKENCYDVLVGRKTEPVKLPPPRNGEDDVETWNEFIKQLAIYNRRNDILFYGLRRNLSPQLRSRYQQQPHAAQIWSELEDTMSPSGSTASWTLFNSLLNTSLANSADLKDYIARLTATHHQFQQLKVNTSPLSANRSQVPSSGIARGGGEVLTEEVVTLLFLRGLGEGWEGFVEGLVGTCNLAGFGTGERVGFREVAKRAEGCGRMMQQQGR